MFKGIDLYEIRYSSDTQPNSLAGIQLDSAETLSAEGITAGQVYLKDCSFILDGLCRVCSFFPISPTAQQHYLSIQSFSYWEAGKAYFTRRRSLDSYLLVYTYGGEGELQYQGKTYTLQKGDAFLIDCQELHQYRTKKAPWKHGVLHMQGVPVEFLYQEFLRQGSICLHLEEEAEFQRRLERVLRAYSAISPIRELQVSSMLTELLLGILMSSEAYRRAQQTMPEQIRVIAHYLNRNFTKEISLDELSTSFSISKYHLCRSFKKYTGLTLNEYVTQLRLERAKELLRTTTLPANQIGSLVGIADENYFYRLFRKHTGQSPHKYRKEAG